MPDQYLRQANLVLIEGTKGLDLSEMRFTFHVKAADVQSPNSAEIRIYNLSEATQQQVKKEYTRVVLQAGYKDGAQGVIFDGTIKQFRQGRENATDTFLDILAADGDIGYNFGVMNRSFAAGTNFDTIMKAAAQDMDGSTLRLAPDLTGSNPSGLARGKVAFGMARDVMRKATQTLGATWSIQNGQVQVVPLRGYLPGDAVVLNSATGMIGIPEQTEVGVQVRSLLNPKIQIGTTLRLNNKDINQLQNAPGNFGVRFDSWKDIQYASKIGEGADGLYRVYVAEHLGDTRGNEWYTDLVCLLISSVSKQVEARN